MSVLRLRVDSDVDLRVEVDGVVFDLDGVLVESAPCWAVAERIAVERMGGTWPETDVDLAGLSPDVAADKLAPHCRLGGRERELEREIEDAAVRVFARDAVAVPGASRILNEVRAVVPVAVATNSPRRLAEASLGATGFRQLVDVLVTVDDVGNGKPAPDVYQEACRRMGLRPSRSLAVDDTPTGVAAALAAGLRCVAFGSGPHVRIDGVFGWIPEWTLACFDAATGKGRT